MTHGDYVKGIDPLTTQWQPSSDAFANRVGDETVMLQIKRSSYYGLDPIGTRIWQGLLDGRLAGDVCKEIADEHDVPLARVQDDTRKFLEELQANDIIVAK